MIENNEVEKPNQLKKLDQEINKKKVPDSKSKEKRKMKKPEIEMTEKSNSAFVEENNEKLANKPPRRARKIKKNNETEQIIEQVDPNILAIIIHQTDKLRTDINIYNPFVRIHILDLDINGQYVKKTKR